MKWAESPTFFFLERPVKNTAWLDRLAEIASGVARANGVEVFDLEHRPAGRRWLLRLTLDRLDGAVTLADCESVSRDLSARLDVEDLVPHAYELEVSSPGIERPLRHAADYVRFAGQKAKLVLLADGDRPGEGREGIVKGIDGESVVMESGGREEHIPLARVKKANLVFEFGKKQ